MGEVVGRKRQRSARQGELIGKAAQDDESRRQSGYDLTIPAHVTRAPLISTESRPSNCKNQNPVV
jgi:hypothetical protein